MPFMPDLLLNHHIKPNARGAAIALAQRVRQIHYGKPVAKTPQLTRKVMLLAAGNVGMATPVLNKLLFSVAILGQTAAPVVVHGDKTTQDERPAPGTSRTSAPSALAGPALAKVSV